MKKILVSLLFVVQCFCFTHAQEEALFSFGVVSDVQYADVDPAGERFYRYSLGKLERNVDFFNNYNLEFIMHLGDLIDRDFESYEKPLAIFGKSKNNVLYVIGNHEYEIDDKDKSKVHKLLGLNKKGYNYFDRGNWRFVMLNGMGLSIKASKEGTKKRVLADKKFEELKRQGAINAYDWNGAIDEKQLMWLDKTLTDAKKRGKRVILFCHLTLLPVNELVLWNHEEVKDLIFKYDNVFAYIGGHDHNGLHIYEKGVHFLAVKGVLNASVDETSCAVVNVYADKLVFEGFGREEDKVWEIK